MIMRFWLVLLTCTFTGYNRKGTYYMLNKQTLFILSENNGNTSYTAYTQYYYLLFVFYI